MHTKCYVCIFFFVIKLKKIENLAIYCFLRQLIFTNAFKIRGIRKNYFQRKAGFLDRKWIWDR